MAASQEQCHLDNRDNCVDYSGYEYTGSDDESDVESNSRTNYHNGALVTVGLDHPIISHIRNHRLWAMVQIKAQIDLDRVSLSLQGQDGCRILELWISPTIKVTKLRDLKWFEVSIPGKMKTGDTRTIILLLSVRKMSQEMLRHLLIDIDISYRQVHNSVEYIQSTQISAQRPLRTNMRIQNRDLDYQINRHTTGKALQEAAELATKDPMVAKVMLKRVADSLGETISGQDPRSQDLVRRLTLCAEAIKHNYEDSALLCLDAATTLFDEIQLEPSKAARGII